MARNKVDITGINTSQIKVIKNKDMVSLFEQFREEKDEIKREFIKQEIASGNMKLVLSIIQKFANRADMDDMFQIGCVGLMKAIENFDLTFGVKFSTYAVPMIQGEVKRYLRDNNAMRISRGIKDIAYKASTYKDNYYMEFGREAKISSIAEELEVSEFQISTALNSLKEPHSLEAPIYNDGGDTIYYEDQISDERVLDKDELIAFREALKTLKPRERDILIERFYIGKSQTEVAKELNISQAQVSRIEKSSMTAIRKRAA